MNEAKKTGSIINIKTSLKTSARLDALVAKYPILTKHAIARAALDFGLGVIERDPKWIEADGKGKL